VTDLPSSHTRLLALLGDPVSHSLSPRFQNAAIRASGVDAVYLALRCASVDLNGLITGIAHAGGAGNVTIPHKEAAAAVVERPSQAVLRTGACNTFWSAEERIHGDNTDVAGVDRSVHDLLGSSAAGLRVLLRGAGGAARAAICALVDAGASEIVLSNRSPDRLSPIQQLFAGSATPLTLLPAGGSLRSEAFDLVVNATSLGLRSSDPHPIPLEEVGHIGAGLDLVYRPGSTTPWVLALRERGIPAHDGRGMLLHQGAAAFERWWGIPPPLEEMRAALSRPDVSPPLDPEPR
jgi:shikimate dehydrogenase